MGKSATFVCIGCGKTHTVDNKYSSQLKYCSNACQQHSLVGRLYADFLQGNCHKITKGVKQKILESQDGKCAICGIHDWLDKPLVMILDHEDGNFENNSPKNVRCICSNCDSQLPTYKSKNICNGRYSRRKRYAEGKSY